MYKLDRIDIKILDILQTDGRMSKERLCEQVGLSRTPCYTRVNRLEKEKVIKRYGVEIDINKLMDFSTTYLTLNLKSHTTESFNKFETMIRARREVLECFALIGGVDYMMVVVTRDISQYQLFIEDLLRANVGIDTYFSHLVIKPVKPKHSYPLAQLLS